MITYGKLLLQEFGQSGADLLGENFKSVDSFDPSIPGKKIGGILLILKLHPFLPIIDLFQEDLFRFSNAIFQIVHDKVDKYGGSIIYKGKLRYLMFWNIPQEQVDLDQENSNTELFLEKTRVTKNIFDSALICIMKIFASIHQKKSRIIQSLERKIKEEDFPLITAKIGLHAG